MKKKKACICILIICLLLVIPACSKSKPNGVEKPSEAVIEVVSEPQSELKSETRSEVFSEPISELSSDQPEVLPPPSAEEAELNRLLKENKVYLTLVNKTNALPENWEDIIVLDTAKNSLGEEVQIEHETLQAFNTLREELLEKEGIQIELDSVYRSVEEQQEIWDEWSADPDKGIGYCEKYLSPPGYSEHHTGLAVDIFIIEDGKAIRENDDMIADVEDFAIIHQYLAEHGFILRYIEGKESITGYAYEPWHFRYVGDPKIASIISKGNMTLEQFLQKY